MHSLVLLDKDDRPITAVSLWSDRRAVGQCEQLRSRHPGERWQHTTGCFLGPNYPLYRLIWYRENEPQLFARAARFASVPSLLMLRLTGEFVEERASAVASGWSRLEDAAPLLLDAAGVRSDQVPIAVEANRSFRLSAKGNLPAELSLAHSSDMLVHTVGPDGALAHLGSAGFDLTLESLTIGTSAAARRLSGELRFPEPAPVDCWAVPLGSQLLYGIASNNGGNVAENIALRMAGQLPGDRPQALTERAFAADFRPDLFLRPYLIPERHLDGPSGCHWIARDGGTLRPLELVRASLECIAFHAASLRERLPDSGNARAVALSGGFALLPFVRDVLAWILPVPTLLVDESVPAVLRGALLRVDGALTHSSATASAGESATVGAGFALHSPTDAAVSATDLLLPAGRLAHLGSAYREKFHAWKEWIKEGALI